jgi:hypothetical protein
MSFAPGFLRISPLDEHPLPLASDCHARRGRKARPLPARLRSRHVGLLPDSCTTLRPSLHFAAGFLHYLLGARRVRALLPSCTNLPARCAAAKKRDEVAGMDHPARRMFPAHEGFERPIGTMSPDRSASLPPRCMPRRPRRRWVQSITVIQTGGLKGPTVVVLIWSFGRDAELIADQHRRGPHFTFRHFPFRLALSADRSGIFIAVSQLRSERVISPTQAGSSESVGAPRRPPAFIIV